MLTVPECGRLSVTAIPVGAVMDPKELTPDHLKEIDLARRLPLRSLAGPVRVSDDGAAEGDMRYRIENPTTRPIEVTVSCSAPGEDWRTGPEHRHVKLEGGESTEIVVGLRREADRFEGAFTVPEIGLQVDVLTEARRISLPESRRPVAIKPVGFEVSDEKTIDRAVRLDGEGACLRVDSEMLAVADGPLTVEARVRPESLQGVQAVVGKTEQSEFTLFLDAGRPTFYVFIGGAYAVAQAKEEKVKAGEWCHLAGVFDGEEARVLLDGRVVGRRKVSGPRKPNNFPLYVGAEPGARGEPNFTFTGLIDEVRISSCARYGSEGGKPALRHRRDEKTRLLLHMDLTLGPFSLDHSGRGCHPLATGKLEYPAVAD